MPIGSAGALAAVGLGREEGAGRVFANAISWGQAGGVYSAGPEEGALQPGRAERIPLTGSLIKGASLHSWVSDCS